MSIVLNGNTGIQNVLGSASAPADTNTTTPTTGIYYPSATTWGVSTAGTNALYIDASQKVGIGTTSPAELLEVNKASASFTVMKATNTNGYGKFGVRDTGPAYIESASSQGIGFYVNGGGTTAAFMDSSGNVGIGTTSPSTYGKFAVTASSGNIGYFEGTASSANINNIVLNATATNSAPTMTMQVNGGTTAIGQVRLFGDSSMLFLNGTSPTEKMRIDSSGNLLVGTTTARGLISNDFNGALKFGLTINNTDSGSAGQTSIGFLRNGSYVGTINTTNTATSYNTSSDYRLKENVTPIANNLATIGALKPVSYDWISDKSKGEGFIAHELQSVIPAAVTGEKDAVNEDGSIKPQGVDYSKIVVHLVAAIQEQQTTITALTARIAALEAK